MRRSITARSRTLCLQSTVISQFRYALASLSAVLAEAPPVIVIAVSTDGTWDDELVLDQLASYGIIQGIQFRAQHFPIAIPARFVLFCLI